MRLHLGHHFYGAGNLGDDFMLAGFLGAMKELAPGTALTACVPFPLKSARRRFPEIEWLPYTDAARDRCIRECDAWLGLGGSPFQAAQSRWFIDHLAAETTRCRSFNKPMFYLGVGIQQPDELSTPEISTIIAQARTIWTRDSGSADRIKSLDSAPVHVAADVSHLFFRTTRPPAPAVGRLTIVPNFDYADWPGLAAFLEVTRKQNFAERIWLAQETRPLPGAERSLYASLPPSEHRTWHLISPDQPGAGGDESARDPSSPDPAGTLPEVMRRWPSGEWLVSARYHAAIAGAWAGSRVVVITTNDKLRAVANDLGAPTLAPNASVAEVEDALLKARPAAPPANLAATAFAACRDFVAAVRSG